MGEFLFIAEIQPKVHPHQDFQGGRDEYKNPNIHCKIIFVSLGIQ